MIAHHKTAVLLSFEGPDRYSSVGGLGTRETSFARALGDADGGVSGFPRIIRGTFTMASPARSTILRRAFRRSSSTRSSCPRSTAANAFS
jgi:hypothetical protein